MTFNDSILSNAVLHEPLISSCTSEVADQRIICHAINLADKGYQHIQIHSTDTDVIILSIAYSEIIFSKGVNVLNVNCGSGKFYYVKSISVQLGADVCKVKFYPFFMHLLVAALFQVSTTMENVNSWHLDGVKQDEWRIGWAIQIFK